MGWRKVQLELADNRRYFWLFHRSRPPLRRLGMETRWTYKYPTSRPLQESYPGRSYYVGLLLHVLLDVGNRSLSISLGFEAIAHRLTLSLQQYYLPIWFQATGGSSVRLILP